MRSPWWGGVRPLRGARGRRLSAWYPARGDAARLRASADSSLPIPLWPAAARPGAGETAAGPERSGFGGGRVADAVGARPQAAVAARNDRRVDLGARRADPAHVDQDIRPRDGATGGGAGDVAALLVAALVLNVAGIGLTACAGRGGAAGRRWRGGARSRCPVRSAVARAAVHRRGGGADGTARNARSGERRLNARRDERRLPLDHHSHRRGR